MSAPRKDLNGIIVLDAHRRGERMAACHGVDPLQCIVAYAQDSLVYDTQNRLAEETDPARYAALPDSGKVNIFGQAYASGTPLYMHHTLADIMVDMAIDLYQRYRWTTIVFDGLRTVDAAARMGNQRPDLVASGLLAAPGKSAHNKGMAVDSMMFDAEGREIGMGGHFDHTDMTTVHRLYQGPAISDAAKNHRILREQAVQRAALKNHRLIAPLRPEFWDDRFPENREDLWRVLESAARCIGISLLSADDLNMLKEDRAAFGRNYEAWSYADFENRWAETFHGHEDALQETLGVISPPGESSVIYHGDYAPLYDADIAERFAKSA